MTHKIVILEDDADIASLYQRELVGTGFTVNCFSRAQSFSQYIQTEPVDCCVLDLGLPDGDGLDILQSVLTTRQIPTIIVSGRGRVQDRINGLDIGADDYLVKPVDPQELCARIRSLLRRSQPASSAIPFQANISTESEQYSFEGWTADFDTFELKSPDGENVTMSHADAILLKAFVHASGRVLSREQLMDVCQNENIESFDRSIDTRVSRLRKKLCDDAKNPALIRTVYGAGYVFTPKVARALSA